METSGRHYHIDWLRTLASYLVVFYHVAQFFDYQKKTYIKNAELSWAMDICTRFVHLWHMPLFFLLAGWSSKRSLDSKGVWLFLQERVKKLFVPLIFGLFVWCVPPRWVELKHGLLRTTAGETLPAQPDVSFTVFVKDYYYSGEFITWGHLWFLAYLFTFSVLYLPGLLIISRLDIPPKWFEGWAGWALVNSPVVALVAIEVTLRERWPGFQNLTDDWANFWSFSTYYWVGFFLAQYPVLETHLHTNRTMNLAIASLSTSLHVLPFFFPGMYQWSAHQTRIWSALAGWCTVLFFLSLATKVFSGVQPPWFWTRRAFPVYVLHDVPLCLLADSLLDVLNATILTKFLSIVVLDLGLTILLHSCLVLSTNLGDAKKTTKYQ